MKLRAACVVVGFLSLALSVFTQTVFTQNMFAQTASTASASAQVPPLILFSNVATDEGGNSMSGAVSITFSLYTAQQGGEPLWTETQRNVQLDPTGHYSVQLGVTQPNGVPTTLFTTGEARWLGVRIAEQVEQSRVLLLSVPYALKAGDAATIAGLPPSAFVLAAPAASSASTPIAADASPAPNSAPPPAGGPVTGTGTLNFLPLWDSTSDIISSALFQSGSGATAKIGINTTKPAATLDVKGASTIRGLLSLPATGVATATKGANSQPLDLAASAFNSGTVEAVTQTFQWQAEPVNNNTSNATGSLNLRFGSGTTKPAETGFNIASNGQITFATGQTFPGTGTITGVTTASGSGLTGGGTGGTLNLALTNTCSSGQVLSWNGTTWVCTGLSGGGTITGVTAGTDLTGGGASGNVTLNLDTTKVPQLGTPNIFAATQTVGSGDLAINTGNLDLPQTASAGSGVITLGGAPFISACCSSTSFNTYLGTGAGNFNTSNSSNTAVGYQALTSNTASTNTAVGSTALTANTTGNSNTAVGTSSLQVNTTGGSNTAVGAGALESNGLGLSNTAVGSGAGHSNTSGTNNTFVGQAADASSQTLTNATAIGSAAIVGESNALVLGAPGVNVGINTPTPAYALDVHGTGNFTGAVTFSSAQTFPNTISGVTTAAGSGLTGGGTSGTLNLALTNTCSSGQVLSWSGSAWACTALSGGGTITGVTAGTDLTGGGGSGNVTLNLDTTKVPQLSAANTFTGNQTVNGNLSATGTVTGSSFQIGSNLFAFGSLASANAYLGFSGGSATAPGAFNTANGAYALAVNAANYNTAAGAYALTSNTSGPANTASGFSALQYNTSGAGNTATGADALSSNSTGSSNTATGYEALYVNKVSGNTADGYQALSSNTTGTGNQASGYQALFSNTVGNNNSGYGYQALYSNISGSSNVASGYQALFSNTYGADNTAIGYQALYSNATIKGGGNTATGYQALYLNSTGGDNTAEGVDALYGNTTGTNNTAVGWEALGCLSCTSNTTGGSFNTAVGNDALYEGDSGWYNSAFGNGAGGTSNETLPTGSSNTFLGANTNLGTQLAVSNATAIGANAQVTASNSMVLGSIAGVNSATASTNVGIGTTAPSNVFTIAQNAGHAIADGWDTYSSRRWKTNIHTLHGALAKVEQLRGVSYDLKANGKHEVGVIAEEVGTVVPEVVSYEENGKDARGVDYSRLTALLIEATKEQQQELAKALRQIKQQQTLLRAQSVAMRNLKAEVRETRETLRKVKAQVAAAQPALVAAK
jgi:hypothetical protein